jgi:NADP-dependent 3-hydroxy acid dehydrogenase YdfG
VSPGLTRTELFDSRPAETRAFVEQLAIPAGAIAEAIGFAINQPANIDVNELIVRPTMQAA